MCVLLVTNFDKFVCFRFWVQNRVFTIRGILFYKEKRHGLCLSLKFMHLYYLMSIIFETTKMLVYNVCKPYVVRLSDEEIWFIQMPY